MDAFDLLGLPAAFELDAGQLDQRYRELQRQLHPDKFVHASSSERRESLSRAVSVNEAYRLLKDELKRAELLFLRLTGTAPDKGQSTAAPELLMEVMELREELAAVRKRGALDEAHALAESVSAREAGEKARLKDAFIAMASRASHEHQETAARALTRLRYYRRFHDEVAALEDDLSA